MRDTSIDAVLRPVPLEDEPSEFVQLVGCVEDCLSDVTITEELKIAFKRLHSCLLEIDTLDLAERQALPKLIDNKVGKKWLHMMNKCIDECVQKRIISISQCDCLIYAGAMAVIRLSGQHVEKGGRRGRQDVWKLRLESQIKKFRKHISQLLAIHQSPVLTARLRHLKAHLFKLYHIMDNPTFLIAIETLKQKVTSLATRIRRYQTRLLRFWQNNTFRRNQKVFYRSFSPDSKHNYVGTPDNLDLITFWKSIFERNASANLDGSWLTQLKEKFNKENILDGAIPAITSEVFAVAIHKLRNWASPGPDGIQGFWWKRFSSVHDFLCSDFHKLLVGDMAIPHWFPIGRTLLIPKCHDLSNPQNYRPITCLNIVYKLWTSCLTFLVSQHCEHHQLIHPAQKGCCRGQYGCADHLLLTNSVWRQVRCKNRSLAVAWIDYKKAYDSVPHNWLLECMRLFNFPPVLVACLERLLPLWRTTLYLQLLRSATTQLSKVSVKCGIFQGDTLSPLLFCLALNPLSYLLDTLKGYRMSSRSNLTHLMYMDDIKLFAQNDKCLQPLIDIVRKFSDDIQMQFGFQKCAKMSATRGKIDLTGPLPTLDNVINELDYGQTY